MNMGNNTRIASALLKLIGLWFLVIVIRLLRLIGLILLNIITLLCSWQSVVLNFCIASLFNIIKNHYYTNLFVSISLIALFFNFIIGYIIRRINKANGI